MGSKKIKFSSKASLPFRTENKQRRKLLHVKQKRARDSLKRDERFRRKREEDKDPSLRAERLKANIPLTIDRKRVWDDVDGVEGDGVGFSVDVSRLKRARTDQDGDDEEYDTALSQQDGSDDDDDDEEEDRDSMLEFNSEDEEDEEAENKSRKSLRDQTKVKSATERATSPTGPTTSTKLDLTPESLAQRFPSLMQSPPAVPKVLITTSINSTLHHEAEILTQLFPNSVYIRRSAHRYAHKYSVREISKFAADRNYTAVLVLKEDQKKPTGLSIVHLPQGPTFHFSISNWIEGKRLPGHGNPTNHYPELILNNFRTPLGLLTAHIFRSLFPPQPELHGRQVVTMHNQRDFIFLRRHRYVFREKKGSEKNVVGTDGKDVKGVEGIRAGLQELGPRFTMKLRRVDKTIQRGTEGVEWEWKGKTDRIRTKFQL